MDLSEAKKLIDDYEGLGFIADAVWPVMRSLIAEVERLAISKQLWISQNEMNAEDNDKLRKCNSELCCKIIWLESERDQLRADLTRAKCDTLGWGDRYTLVAKSSVMGL